MPVLKLTSAFMSSGLICPEGQSRIEYCDSEVRGLLAECRSTSPSVATWYIRFKQKGRTAYKRIGITTDITLADARKQAKVIKGEIASGINPKGEVKKAVLTFSEFFNDHYLPYVTPRKRSWKRDEELYRLRIKKVFGDKKLNEITRQQIQAFHTTLLAEGLAPATCDHHIKLLKHSLNMAIDWDLLAEKNPAARVPLLNVENRVNNLLEMPALRRLIDVLNSHPNKMVCAAALVSLHTGCRLSEILSARWQDVNLENKQWHISGEVAKGKRAKVLPLSQAAISVFCSLSSRGQHEFVIVSRTGQRMTTLAKTWSRICHLANLPHYRYHDLRHQFATHLARSGCSTVQIQNLLSHRSPVTTQKYLHMQSSDLLVATNSTSAIFAAAMAIPEMELKPIAGANDTAAVAQAA